MRAALLVLLSAFAISQDDKPKGPTEKEVEAAVAKLEAVFEKKDHGEIYTGLQAITPLAHEDVIEIYVDEGLAHRSMDVKRASIEALGVIKHEDALEALHKHAKKNKKALKKDADQFVPLLRAIAQHQSEDSIPVLIDGIFTSDDNDIVQARILGLGKIRSRKSVEELFSIMRKTDRRKVQRRMNDVRLALCVLTHVDEGTDQDRWTAWWNDNKKTFELPNVEPIMPKDLARRWGNFWGYERQYDRQKKRGDRGNDPEDG